MADRAAREGCGPCAARARAREAAKEKAAANGSVNPGQTATEKSDAELLINTRPAGR